LADLRFNTSGAIEEALLIAEITRWIMELENMGGSVLWVIEQIIAHPPR
jgi:hypothetical protein